MSCDKKTKGPLDNIDLNCNKKGGVGSGKKRTSIQGARDLIQAYESLNKEQKKIIKELKR